MKNLVVISNWLERDTISLFKLVTQLANINPGIEYHLCIVCNHSDNNKEKNTNKNFENIYLELINILHHSNWPPATINLLFRENIGMNIGAWDFAWRRFPNFTHYMFLQDEVIVMNNNWLISYVDSIKTNNVTEETPFLIGESWNYKWDHPWSLLRKTNFNSISHGHSLTLGRVDFYLNTFKKWGVMHGDNGGHLRSLIWFSNFITLKKINGFNIGNTYGECIASEIAATLKVKQFKGFVSQIDSNHFRIFWHPEWRRDGSSKAI